MWPAWRLVVEGIATLEELNRSWSLCDMVDANDVLDAWRDAQREANEQPK